MSNAMAAAFGGRNWSPRTAALHEELGSLWGDCGIRDEFSTLRAVLLHRPGAELARVADPDAALMLSIPDAGLAGSQHDALAAAYRDEGVSVHAVDPPGDAPPNQMFVADLMFMTPAGAIVGRPASTVRAGEERWVARRLADVGIPIVRTIGGNGTFEGADAMWLADDTVLVGRGLRTNRDGAAQVAAVLADLGVRTIEVDLSQEAMHLMGQVRIVDRDLAFVVDGHTPWFAIVALRDLGFDVQTFPSPEEMHNGMAHNFVALAPRRILMAAGNPRSQAFYEELGVSCRTVDIRELTRAAGGIGCLSGVLWRQQ
jgi:arginine deiminase